jgi:hypothetical protein
MVNSPGGCSTSSQEIGFGQFEQPLDHQTFKRFDTSDEPSILNISESLLKVRMGRGPSVCDAHLPLKIFDGVEIEIESLESGVAFGLHSCSVCPCSWGQLSVVREVGGGV